MLQKFWQKIRPFVTNKYFVCLFIFLVWMLFFADYNVFRRWAVKRDIRDVRQEIESTRRSTELDRQKIEMLNGNSENLEKFAREEFFMSKENEEVFLVDGD